MKRPAGPVTLLAASLLLAFGCGEEATAPVKPQATRSLERVTTNFSMATLGHAPLMIAKEEGYFEDEGIDLVLEKLDANTTMLAIASGQLDVMTGPVRSGLFNVMLKGVPLQVVADRGHSEPGHCSAEAFAAPPAMAERIAKSGFRGERFVLIRGGTTEYVIDRLLEKNNLTRKDVEFAQIVPQGDQVSRLLDAVRLMAEPNLSNVVSRGLMKEVVGMEEVAPGHQFSVLVYGPRLIRDEPDLGRRFMRAYLRGITKYGEGKTDRNVEILSRFSNLPPDIVRRACWPAIHPEGRINPEVMAEFLRWARKNEYLDAEVPTAMWWNPSYIDAALRPPKP